MLPLLDPDSQNQGVYRGESPNSTHTSLPLLVLALPGLPIPICNSNASFSGTGIPLSINPQSMRYLCHSMQQLTANPLTLCSISLFISRFSLTSPCVFPGQWSCLWFLLTPRALSSKQSISWWINHQKEWFGEPENNEQLRIKNMAMPNLL